VKDWKRDYYIPGEPRGRQWPPPLASTRPREEPELEAPASSGRKGSLWYSLFEPVVYKIGLIVFWLLAAGVLVKGCA